MSDQRNCRINTHPGTHYGSHESGAGICGISAVSTLIHRVCPRLAVVSGPMVEQEIRRIVDCGDQKKSPRLVREDDDGGFEISLGHQAPYSSFEAKASGEAAGDSLLSPDASLLTPAQRSMPRMTHSSPWSRPTRLAFDEKTIRNERIAYAAAEVACTSFVRANPVAKSAS
jgi:hypothetical protein